MKKTILLTLSVLTISGLFAQTQTQTQRQYSAGESNKKQIKYSSNPKFEKGTEFFCEDFSAGLNGSTAFGAWTFEDDGTGEGGVVEEGTISMSNGVYSNTVDLIESTSAANGYVLIDVDGYNTTNDLYVEGVAPGLSAYLISPELDMSEVESAVLSWEHYFRYCCYNFSPFTVEISTDDGATWELFAAQGDFLEAANEFSDNGASVSIDITDATAGQSSVFIRWAYNSNLADIYDTYGASYFAYFWAFDDICITEKPQNDVQINYSVISHIPETGLEYGSTPFGQLNTTHALVGNILNFGVAEQTNVTFSASFTNGETDIELTENIGTMAPSENVDIVLEMAENLSEGVYNGTFTLVSDAETEGDNYYNNVEDRTFAITDGLYALDGINVYPNAVVTDLGPGNFVDDGEPFDSGALLTMYDILEPTELWGVRVLITDNDDMVGSEIFAFLADTADVFENDLDNPLLLSDFYSVTESDVAGGYIDLFFEDVEEFEPNTYFAGVFIISGSEFRVLDDVTVPQPGMASALFLDQTYSNGNALAIQLYTVNPLGIDEVSSLDFDVFQNIPNPASVSTAVSYNLQSVAEVSLDVIDITGRIIMTLDQGKKSIGKHSIEVDVEKLSAGVYTYTLNVGVNQASKKLIVE